MKNSNNLIELLTNLSKSSLTVKTYLHEEQAALSKRDSDLIIQTAQHKQRAINDLNQYIGELNITLKSLGYKPKSSIEDFFKRKLNNQSITLLWQQCKTTITECNAINRNNSALVSSGIKQTMLALNFLTNSVQGEADHHYDKSGIQTGKVSYGMDIKA